MAAPFMVGVCVEQRKHPPNAAGVRRPPAPDDSRANGYRATRLVVKT